MTYLRIDSNKERIRKVGRGNFDDSFFDKKGKESIEYMHDKCSFCGKPLKATADKVASEGRIIMTCNTKGCPGNIAYDKSNWSNKYRDLKRAEDRELVWDLAQIATSKPYHKLWANKKYMI